MFSAKQAQKLLGIEDEQCFCKGYTLDRRTILLYFKNDKVIRKTYHDPERPTIEEFTQFAVTDLLNEYKRVYEKQTDKSFIDFVNSFSLMTSLALV